MVNVKKYGRGPAKFRQIRSNGKNQWGKPINIITVPELISDQFKNVFFSIRCSDHQIILESGCKNE